MKLARLSNACIAGCVAGLVALLAIGLMAHGNMREKQGEMAQLLDLQKRLDDLSAGSDSLLLFGGDTKLGDTFRTGAESLRRQLRAMGDDFPAARTAAREIGLIIEALEDANAFAAEQAETPSNSNTRGPLEIPERSRIVMNQVASHGVALDTALDRLLRDRQQTIATEAMWIAGSFAVAALAFAVLSLLAFGLIHRRISGPVQALASTIDRIRAGESGLRAASGGDSELARLAGAFNRLLDERDATDQRIARQQEALRDRERVLAESQRTAHVGSWRLDILEDRFEWSEETFRIVGLNPTAGEPTPEGFLGLVHGDDRAHLIDLRARARKEDVQQDYEYRVVRPDGSIRRIHEIAETERDESGRIVALSGTIQDITERNRAERQLQQQHHLIESGSDLFCVIDADHRYVFANHGYAALYGLTGETIEGLHLLDVLSREFYEREVVPRLNRCLAGESISFEGDRTYPHLGTRHFLIRYFPVAAVEGNGWNIGSVMTDITDVRHAEETLREQAQLLDIAGRVARFGGWWVDLDNQRITWSDMVAEIHARPHGYSPTFDEGLAYYAHEYRDAMRERFTACAEQGVPYDEEMRILDAREESVWVRVVAEPVRDVTGRIHRVQGAFQDVTKHHEMEAQLRTREEELRVSRDELAATLATRQSLINALPAHIALVDGAGTVLDVNEHWRRYEEENNSTDAAPGIGRNWLAGREGVSSQESTDALEMRAGLKSVLDGEQASFSLEYSSHAPKQARWFRMMVNRLGDESGAGAVIMHLDITERKLAEQELNRLAYQDALTGIPSRNGFVQALADRLWQTGWQPDAMIVMFDIQHHRDINDSHGYAVGDQLLQAIAERIDSLAGEDGLAGRVGGDEFVVFLPEHPDLGAARQREWLGAAFDAPFELGELQIDAKARFGYTLLGEHARANEELLREAELALFECGSGDGNNDWIAYDSAIDHEVRQRVEITQELRHAITHDEFQLHFQPKVKLETGELVASEALLRWHHPEAGLRSPGTFIPIAEQSQLIGPIGDWALDQACRHLREWQDARLDIVRLAVNVSLVQFMVGDFPETVRSALNRHDVPPDALTLEITESVFERESDTLNRQLSALHDMGVRLSLDDFGTGYSSLLYLQRYPFDEIKIDQGFVRGMLHDDYSRQIVSTVIGVAGALNAEAVAEGVETIAERDALLQMGCRIGQGFYFSMPLESEDFRWLLEQRSSLPLLSAGGRA